MSTTYTDPPLKPELFLLVKSMSVKTTVFDNTKDVKKEIEKRIGTRCVLIVEGSGNVESHQEVGYFQEFNPVEVFNSQGIEFTLDLKKIENTRS